MARDLMPKSGIVMPHIVITRDAAVVGVSTVDGKAGAVTLSGTYAKVTDVYKKTETYSQSEVDNLIEPIMQRAMFKDDPYIDNNTALRSGGANGITSIDLIKADADNSIHIGDLSAGVQGVHLYSEGKIDVAYKDANGADAIAALYSQRYRPATGELPFAVVGTYTTDAKGRTTGVTKDGNNSDIKKLNALTGVTTNAVTFEKSPIVPTPVNDTEVPNKKYVDDAVAGNKGSGGYVGETFWHPSRANLPGGTVPGDGQLISGASTLYPDLVALVQAGKLPNTTETTWQAQPTARAAYVYDSTADTLRMPDLNGIQTGSIKAPVMRGDGGALAAGSVQKGGVPNFYSEFQTSDPNVGPVRDGTKLTGAFKKGSVVSTYRMSGEAGAGYPLVLDPSIVSDVFQTGLTEVRANSVVGCYVIRVATAAQNGGSVDMLSLQSQVEELRTAAVATDSKIGYALLTKDTDAGLNNPALNSRVVCVNPFGANTPVICFAEIFHATLQKWISFPWVFNGANATTSGNVCSYSEGEGIVLQLGKTAYVSVTSAGGSSGNITTDYTTPSPVRIHVFSIGKDISKLKQISQIDPVLIQEFKAPVQPTGLREVWRRNGAETGVSNTNLTFSESILGKVLYLSKTESAATQWVSIGCKVPAVKPPHMSVFHVVFTISEATSFNLEIAADGKSARLIFSTLQDVLEYIYTDDYSVQP